MKEVDDYVSAYPNEISEILNKIRSIIKIAAPEAVESISYAIPAYKLKGKPLVYFAAFKNHIGLYATPSGHEKFAKELSKYKQGKGSVQFPFSEPLPFDLIERIVVFKVNETKK